MEQTFETAKLTLGLLQVLGWAAVAAGGAVGIFAAEEVGLIVSITAGSLLALIGLGIVVGVQLAIAQISTAEHSGAILAEVRKLSAPEGSGGILMELRKLSSVIDGGQVVSDATNVASQPQVHELSGSPAAEVVRVKGYMGYEISRNGAGRIVVGTKEFRGLLQAEKYIREEVSKGTSEA
jgi:hypothetical protein